MGLILLICMAVILAWWWQKLLITVRPKDAQWYLQEALKRDPRLRYRLQQQPPILSCTPQDNDETTDWDQLSKAELIAIIRKLSQ